jgi:hypothetical protein
MNAPDDSHFRFIGRPICRREDARSIACAARFGDDAKAASAQPPGQAE